jgi:hypothetical protein
MHTEEEGCCNSDGPSELELLKYHEHKKRASYVQNNVCNVKDHERVFRYLHLKHEKKIHERTVEDLRICNGNENVGSEELREVCQIAQEFLVYHQQVYIIEVGILVNNTLCVDDTRDKGDQKEDVQIPDQTEISVDGIC